MTPHAAARIDAHQHFWRYDAAQYGWIDDAMAALRRDFLPEDLAPMIERAGFAACVAVQARQTVEETRWLLALADAYPFIAGVVGWIDLQSVRVRADLEAVARHPKLVGIRHIAQAEPDDRFLVRPAFVAGLARLEEFDLAYDILIYSRHLRVASELAAHPNVCAKLSGLVTEADWTRWTAADIRPVLDVAFDCFGPERLMVGSDWPVCMVAGDYGRTMSVVIDYVAVRPAHERDAVLGGNAQRFWKLTVRT